MSIINNAHAGSQINLLCLIYRVIFRNNQELSIKSIESLCRPGSLPKTLNAKKRFKENLDFWCDKKHQLWKVNDKEKLELISLINDDPTPDIIARETNKVLFGSKIKNLFEDDSDTRFLFIGLSAILASDNQNKFLLGSKDSIKNTTIDDFYNKYLPKNILPNNSEKPTLIKYGNFLGFFEYFNGNLIADPTRAVKCVIDDIFLEKKKISIIDFRTKLSAILPVLDGGDYRKQVEEKMTSKKWERPSGISNSLGFAIKRLATQKIISLESGADDQNAEQILGERYSYIVKGGLKT
tara:strand:+ start:3417 stop:4301 length:885 start_codon:yes stop_codon:yes gene_type:complete